MPILERLSKKARELRRTILRMCVRAGTGHVTSSMSSIEILTALYYGGILRYDPRRPRWEGRDRFVVSKGQASPALYAVLADLGFFSRRDLDRFARKGGKFGVHLQNDVPGVEMTAGSLGIAFSAAVGMALALKMDKKLPMVCALLGDGECYEGSVWEAALFASHYRLNNLVAVVDRNYLCATDFTEDIVALEPLDEKWRSFGWDVARVDGHNLKELLNAIRPGRLRSRRSVRPLVVIADTVKGKEVESMSYRPFCHGIAPRGREARRALRALAGRESGHA